MAESHYHVCTAHHEFLSEALRELAERVNEFLDIGCIAAGPLSVVIQPETWRARRHFYVAQPIIREGARK